MKNSLKTLSLAVVLLISAIMGPAVAVTPSSPSSALNQCKCSIKDTGDAMCFFDGVKCPASGGKCSCAK